jgi:pyruvate dehydrogenase E1 component alpha subunit
MADSKPQEQEVLLGLYRQMVEVRHFEDEVQRQFLTGGVRGTTHLCQGQEAVPVGACSVLREGDTMTCTYRGHGAVLAMGAPLEAAFAEIFGRETGLCRGKGGSMHLTDLSVGALGSFAVVGAGLPVAVGAAWTAQYRRTGACTLTFFGDGTTNIGAFHEAANLASVWSLPVVFICENNLYGEYSPLRATTPLDNLSERAASYAMPAARVDGNDVLAVQAAVGDAVKRARDGNGPTFIEALTYRHHGHSRTDPATYRPPEELEEWRARDPLLIAERALAKLGVGADEVEHVATAARGAVEEARDRALESPQPPLELMLEDVYASQQAGALREGWS